MTVPVAMRAALFAALWLLAAPGLAQARETLRVERGQERYVTLDAPVRRFSVGDPALADVSLLDGKTLRVLGLALGETSMSLWREGAAQPALYTLQIVPRIAALKEKFSADRNLRGAKVSVYGDKILLDGQFADAQSRDKAREIAKAMTGSDVVDVSEVGADEVVQIDVEFITVTRRTIDALGLNFTHLGHNVAVASATPNTPVSIDAGQAANFALSTISPIGSAFNLLLGSPRFNSLSILSALKNNNLAQTLAQPRLVVRSGEKADFLVGGEIPIPVPSGDAGNSITIEYKRFGVSLKVAPTILKDRRIALTIHPEVSELDFSNGLKIEGFTVPALRTRETETTVEVNENESLILAGLMYETTESSKEKMPYIGDVPVLGAFFRRTQKSHDVQELIVTVTPRLVTARTQDRALADEIAARFVPTPRPKPEEDAP